MSMMDAAYSELIHFHGFFTGITCAMNLIAAVLFLRFYRWTSDRLFIFFAVAFLLLSVSRIAFYASGSPNEAQPALYVVRLIAFCVILYGIFDKNRIRKASNSTTS